MDFLSRFLCLFICFFTQDNTKASLNYMYENIELLPVPSTSQSDNTIVGISLSAQNIQDDDEDADDFTTRQLFSFAWQIAKGMVMDCILVRRCSRHNLYSCVNRKAKKL